MKSWKICCYLFVYPVLLLGTGFLGGALFVSSDLFRYEMQESPQIVESNLGDQEESGGRLLKDGTEQNLKQHSDQSIEETNITGTGQNQYLEKQQYPENTHNLQTAGNEESVSKDQMYSMDGETLSTEPVLEVLQQEERLNADTVYVLEETDLRNRSVVETRWSLPNKYIGMNRNAFLDAMQVYEASPPLEELERGFVSLEVLRFSREEVVVQMNYDYVQPTKAFYLMARDHYVIVCLEDMQTVYMITDIHLKDLPEELRQQIMQSLLITEEEALYDFLENYSS